MNCLLIGLGPHAKRIYLEFLQNETYIDKVIVVDLVTEKEKVESILNKTELKYELILLNNSVRNNKELSEEDELILYKTVKENNIKKVIISTEPRSHKMYIDFCLKYGLDIMCDKPITTPLYTNTFQGSSLISEEYDELLENFENSNSEMFEIQTQRRAHKGYRAIRKIISDVVQEYKVPINKITISHSDGTWSMPSETVFRENHPYKYGYGKLMHSGYHFLDLLSFFIEINEENGFSYHHKSVMSTDYRPNDFYSYFGKKFNEKLGFFDKNEYYENLNIVRNFGEFDISAIVDYKDNDENIITTAHLELSQSGFSKRAWFDLPEDTYKGNGRIRHEFVDITVGPLLNIKVLSYQSSEVGEGKIDDNSIGGLDHFDILVFRNSAIIGGKTFEKLNLNNNDERNYYLGQNEVARFDILRDYFLSKKSYSNISKHKEAISLLSDLHYNMSKRFKDDNFRFAVEVLLRYNGKYLICQRSLNAKVAPGIWNIPAGKVKHNEGIEEAILRECQEETNIQLKNVEYLDYSFINKEHKRIVYLYFSELEDISDLKIDDTEFDDWKFIEPSEVDKIPSLNLHIKKWIKKIECSEGKNNVKLIERI
ncbi:NUDIX domain-containing protein [Enterococcus sp. BWB1-3]|uniref:NUDIX domain-containing protein n=1 Tax=Enterococcus sp. BWB1-3 TaxID=2787713 RepID=UPI001924334B|nr:NUDIX domain-containing protein [Enterococcus sp. BWB1-3]MBL1228438.1 NUDIX domain-containing protein [Enterococcus sp. BWB1-3]